ncbi:hypothetical protein HCN51_36065 [Nonomuraea sp. FMUSA5-5]|uniref:Uncharacterized protein n=1 Tax=Nonomuraea composti TaxID=2720023 RepID=A0ABX1BE68_9ACTN|nr:hypothetical protein [Nonomuraea sp. FMUSA5-5]NJP94792.1 hypothetical protein [Nonomuraea sp. FMUSA5-5]
MEGREEDLPVEAVGRLRAQPARDVPVDLPALFGDGAGRTGTSSATAAPIALNRDGRLVTEAPRPFLQAVQVPPGDAAYNLQAEAGRAGGHAVHPRVGHLDVPLRHRPGRHHGATAVGGRLLPRTGPAQHRTGRPFTVPLTVRTQAGSTTGEVP